MGAQASSANTRVKRNELSVEIHGICQLIIVQCQQKKNRNINVVNYFEL